MGVKENPAPQCAQKPSLRPARPSCPRPTSLPHRLQNRSRSGTCGSVMIAVEGSRYGTGAIVTSPAPRWPRLDREVRFERERLDPRRVERREMPDEAPATVAERGVGADRAAASSGARPQTVQ